MDTERDEYFSPQDADRRQLDADWERWSEELDAERDWDAYLIQFFEYYGNRNET
jgi:hypothetical protein